MFLGNRDQSHRLPDAVPHAGDIANRSANLYPESRQKPLNRVGLGEAHPARNAPVAEVGLQRSGIDAIVGELEPVGAPPQQRPGVYQAPASAARSIFGKAGRREWRPALRDKHEWHAADSRWSFRRARISRPVSGCVAGVPRSTLRTCKTARLNRLSRRVLTRVGHAYEQDHRGVTVAISVLSWRPRSAAPPHGLSRLVCVTQRRDAGEG